MNLPRLLSVIGLSALLGAPALAQTDPAAATPENPRTAYITMRTDVRALQLYREACLQQIAAVARDALPRDAEGRVPPGHMLLSLEIAEDGRLVSAEVLQPASSRQLTASALDAVRRAAPFPPLSTALRREFDRVVLTLPLDFGR
ncbi:energy transducer TonB [Uliginosibacterium paludis]|uniref:Energy transducer TonB n=1 Tax=Uliginosibacterium paludis TaxID=1615952 RepID=A0ABV2CV63_9RHOO